MKVIEIDKRLSGSMGVTREMPIEMEKLLDFFRVSSDDIREFILAVTGQIHHLIKSLLSYWLRIMKCVS